MKDEPLTASAGIIQDIMGAKQQAANDQDVVYVSVPLTEQEKTNASKDPQKPLPGYAYIRQRRPAMYPEVEASYETLKAIKLRDPQEKGEKLPLYELAAMAGCFYDGEWSKGRPNGRGCLYGKNGIFYKGSFVAGVATCEEGLFIYPDGSYYIGHFKDNTFHGLGKFTHKPNGTVYDGNWRDDRPNGRGVEYYPDTSRYEGDFKDGKKHGEGKYTWADSKIYKGQFVDGHIDGKGQLLIKGRRSFYEGEFARGQKSKGKLITDYGTYEGQFLNGLMHDSKGTFTWHDGKGFVGPFEYGEMHGQGTISCSGGQQIHGRWDRGKNVAILSMRPYN